MKVLWSVTSDECEVSVWSDHCPSWPHPPCHECHAAWHLGWRPRHDGQDPGEPVQSQAQCLAGDRGVVPEPETERRDPDSQSQPGISQGRPISGRAQTGDERGRAQVFRGQSPAEAEWALRAPAWQRRPGSRGQAGAVQECADPGHGGAQHKETSPASQPRPGGRGRGEGGAMWPGHGAGLWRALRGVQTGGHRGLLQRWAENTAECGVCYHQYWVFTLAPRPGLQQSCGSLSANERRG